MNIWKGIKMKIRRKKWTPENGKCCADCDLFTEDSYSGITSDKDGKYGLNIWGTCEVTEKVIDSADKYYCKCFIQGRLYETRCKNVNQQ